MADAALARRARLQDARLYLCTPSRPDLAEFLDAVLSGGVDVVQLREKGVEARQELALCEVVAAAAERHGALWSVNDRADVASVGQPDVLHLGQDDLPVAAARRILGAGRARRPVLPRRAAGVRGRGSSRASTTSASARPGPRRPSPDGPRRAWG